MEFIKNNALLIGLAIGSGVMLISHLIKRGGVPNLSTADAVNLINRNNALLLDVRDQTEYATGHILDAKNIPLSSLNNRLSELDQYKNIPILVNCQRGARSAKACEILNSAGFSQVHNLQGGIEAWLIAKLPVVKDK